MIHRFALLVFVAASASGCNSASPRTEDADWLSVVLCEGQVKAYFPDAPRAESLDVETAQGNVHFQSRKSMVDGIFFNARAITFPQSVIDAKEDKRAFLIQLAKNAETAKPGATRVYLRSFEESAVPAVEHRFRYPAGSTGAGQQYAPGFSIYRTWLLDDTVFSLFVDVVQSAYDSEPAVLDQRIDKFFSTAKVTPHERSKEE